VAKSWQGGKRGKGQGGKGAATVAAVRSISAITLRDFQLNAGVSLSQQMLKNFSRRNEDKVESVASAPCLNFWNDAFFSLPVSWICRALKT